MSPDRPASAAGAEPRTESAVRANPNVRKFVHDMRNVVAPLSNAAQLLRLKTRTDAQLAPIADMLERQVAQMVALLNELSDAVPRAATAVSPPADSRKQGAPGARRILIVDDNVALLTSLSSVLGETGHIVKTAEDGPRALELAASFMPEFVLLDAAMPQMNGFEVARQLRASFAPDRMKLVLMSGSTLDDTTRRGAERAGFDYCIDKIDTFSKLERMLAGANG